MTTPMTYGGHVRALLTLGIPLIGGHLGQFAIQVTDTLMLGWYDVEALAAAVLGGMMFFVLFIMGSGFAFAVMPLVAMASENGEGDQQIRRVTRMGLWLSLAFGIVSMPIMLNGEAIFLAIGQAPGVSAQAGSYLQIAAWGILPALGVMVLKSYLAALERTRVVLWVTILAAVTNALVNYTLIFGNFGAPEMGIRGAAVGSVSVQVVSLVGLVLYALRAFPEHTLFVRFWRADWSALGEVFRLGWPIGFATVTEVGLFAASAVMIGWLGTIPLAAHGIALQIASATFLVHLGLSNATTVRAGKALGRRDADHMARGGRVAIALSIGFSCVTIVVFLIWRETLVGLFIAPDDPDRPAIVALGAQLMLIAALFQLADGGQIMAHGLLRGVQDARIPMLISVFGYWMVGLPAGYLGGFVLGGGAMGVWGGLVVGLVVAGGMLMYRFWWQVLPRLRASLAA